MEFVKRLYSMKANPPSFIKIPSNTEMKSTVVGYSPVKPAKGALKALGKMIGDPLSKNWRTGFMIDDSGDIWTRSINHDESKGEEVIVRYSPANREVGIGILDSTGSLRAYDETQRCPYEVVMSLIVHFIMDDQCAFRKEDFNKIVDEFQRTGEINDTEEAFKIMNLIYYVGKDKLPVNEEDFEEIRSLPEFGLEIGTDIFGIDDQRLHFFDEAPHSASTAPQSTDTRTTLERMQTLRSKFKNLVSGFVRSLSPEMTSRVPSDASVQDYIPTQEFEDVCSFVGDNLSRGKMYNNILFWGPPGNGKSAFAKALAYVFQMPYYFEQGFGSKDAGDYAGTTVANNGVLNTSVDTAFVKAMRDGGVFADDDFNYAKEAEQTFKNSILEAPFTAKLANLTEIKRNTFAIYIATANPDCKGARGIPEAFKNRCFIDMHWQPLPDDLLVQHIIAESEFTDTAKVRRMVEAYHVINNSIGTGMDKKEEANLLTPRNLVYWATQARVLNGDVLRAAEYNLIGALGSDASDAFIKQVREKILAVRFKK